MSLNSAAASTARISDAGAPAPSLELSANNGTTLSAPRRNIGNPLLNLLHNVRSNSEQLVHSNNLQARTEYSGRLAGAAVYFRTLSLEMATRANALTLISRLPKEVFVMIVTSSMDHDHPHPAWRVRSSGSANGTAPWIIQKGSLGWVKMTHVCRAWRATLLDACHLWAQNVGVLPKAVLTFLERAGPTAPLDIEFRLSPQTCGLSCEALYAPLPLDRVRHMSWSLHETPDSTYLHRNIATPERGLPTLETLEIDCDYNVEPRALDRTHYGRFLLPNLRSLNVNRFYVPFAMPNLTELFLYRPPVPMPDILDDLRASTSLSYARFERCRFSPMKSPLALPHLKMLYLDCCDTPEDQSVYDLFETFMALPASTKLNIIVGGPSDENDPDLAYTEHDMLAVLQFCTRSHARSGTAPNILTLDGNSDNVRLSWHKECTDIHDPIWHGPWLLGSTVLAQVSSIGIQLENMLKMAVAPIVFHAITVLSVVVDPWMPWELVYEALPNVHTLRLDVDFSGKAAFEALGRGVSNGALKQDTECAPMVLLPRLRFIWVDGDSFCGKWHHGWEDGEEMRQSVMHALKTRADLCAQAGTPRLQTLCLQNVKDIRVKGDAWLHELRKVVPVVECINAPQSVGNWGWDLD